VLAPAGTVAAGEWNASSPVLTLAAYYEPTALTTALLNTRRILPHSDGTMPLYRAVRVLPDALFTHPDWLDTWQLDDPTPTAPAGPVDASEGALAVTSATEGGDGE
jgi:hypothetical protein